MLLCFMHACAPLYLQWPGMHAGCAACMQPPAGSEVMWICVSRRIPDWGHPLWVALSPPGQPSKQRLMDVKSFFQYTEEAGVEMSLPASLHHMQ